MGLDCLTPFFQNIDINMNQKTLFSIISIAAFANAFLSVSSVLIYLVVVYGWIYPLHGYTYYESQLSQEDLAYMMMSEIFYDYRIVYITLESIKLLLCISLSILIYGVWNWIPIRSKFLALILILAAILSVLFLFLSGLLGILHPWTWRLHRSSTEFDGFFRSIYIWPNVNTVTQCNIISLSFMGIWYLIINMQGLHRKQFPKTLAMIGIVLGGISLFVYPLKSVSIFVFPFPPIELLIIVLSVIWMSWLGYKLLKSKTQTE